MVGILGPQLAGLASRSHRPITSWGQTRPQTAGRAFFLLDEPGGLYELSRLDEAYEAWNVHFHRTARHAGRLFAVKTAASLDDGEFAVEAVGDLVEVADAEHRVLLGLLLPEHLGFELVAAVPAVPAIPALYHVVAVGGRAAQ